MDMLIAEALSSAQSMMEMEMLEPLHNCGYVKVF